MQIAQQLKKFDRPKRSEMTRLEKIIAHYVQGLKLSASDENYRELCELAHRYAHAGRNRMETAKLLFKKHGVKKSSAYKLINDAEELFGNVNKSNRKGLEYLTIEWLKKIAHKCMEEKNWELAIQAIDKMAKYGHVGEKKGNINIKTVLMPQNLIFSSDPKALEMQIQIDAEEAEYDEVE